MIYYDIQKLFSWFNENIKLRRSLEYAIDCLDIEKEKDFHRALEDAEYTARVFAKLDMAEILPYYSIDTYQPPNNRKKKFIFHILHMINIYQDSFMIGKK